jgi:hypothetical protein
MNAAAWIAILIILLSTAIIGYMAMKFIRESNALSRGSPTANPNPRPPLSPGVSPVPDPARSPTDSPSSKNNTYSLQELYAQLKKPSSDSNGKKRGILAHMVTMADVNTWLDQKPFSLEANDDQIVDCGVPLRMTCSAWTYLRTDLFPCVYIRPTADDQGRYATALCGILVDADAILDSDMVTSMSILDSDTDARGCCMNDNPNPQFIYTVASQDPVKNQGDSRAPCGNDWASNVNCYNIPAMWEGYSLEKTKTTVCNPSCENMNEADTKVCKANLSGGGLQIKNLGCIGCDYKKGKGDTNTVISNWGADFCDDYSKSTIGSDNWLEKGGCDLCKFNNFCYLSDKAPEGAETLPQAPNQWSKFVVDRKNYNAGNLIGKDGSGIQRSYLFQDPNDASKTLLNTTFDTAQITCRFRPEDWDTWIEALKQYYRAWHSHYVLTTDSSGKPVYNMNLIQPWDCYCPTFLNYTLGHPQAAIYLENEVNLYMYPKNVPEVEDEARKQSATFRDAIVGFFYVGKTCLEFMEDLNQSDAQFAWFEHDAIQCDGTSDPKKFHSARDRCVGFYCEDWKTESVPPGSTCPTDMVDNEERYIRNAIGLVELLKQKFNSTYRKSPDQQKVGSFKYVGQSNTFFHYPTLDRVVRDQLQPEDFFAESDFSTMPLFEAENGEPLNFSKGGVQKQIGRPQFPKDILNRSNLLDRAPMIPV